MLMMLDRRGTSAAETLHDIRNRVAVADDKHAAAFCLHRFNQRIVVGRIVDDRRDLQFRRQRSSRFLRAPVPGHEDCARPVASFKPVGEPLRVASASFGQSRILSAPGLKMSHHKHLVWLGRTIGSGASRQGH